MSTEHLSPECLARLVDEPPTAAERTHLEACEPCAFELDELRRQTARLGRLPDLRPFPADFGALEAQLAAEGLVRSDRRAHRAEPAFARSWIRRAAAVALFAGGAVSGATAAGRMPAAGDPAVVAQAAPSDPAGALARVQQTERDYQAALVQYRQLAGDAEVESGDPLARYEALASLVQAGQAAVRQAPADPFVNGLLASALAEQQAVYRRIEETGAARQDGWF